MNFHPAILVNALESVIRSRDRSSIAWLFKQFVGANAQKEIDCKTIQQLAVKSADLYILEQLIEHGMVVRYTGCIMDALATNNALILDAVVRSNPDELSLLYNDNIDIKQLQNLLATNAVRLSTKIENDLGRELIQPWVEPRCRYMYLLAFFKEQLYHRFAMGDPHLHSDEQRLLLLEPKFVEARVRVHAQFAKNCWMDNRHTVVQMLIGLAPLDLPALLQYEICTHLYPRFTQIVSMHRFWLLIAHIRNFLSDEQKQDRLVGVYACARKESIDDSADCQQTNQPMPVFEWFTKYDALNSTEPTADAFHANVEQ